jgi:hypothetical protein
MLALATPDRPPYPRVRSTREKFRNGQERVDPLPDSAIRTFRQPILPFAVRRRGIKLNSLEFEVRSDRQVFSPVVGEEPFDLGAELSVHPGLELSELLERFMFPSHGIFPRATKNNRQ